VILNWLTAGEASFVELPAVCESVTYKVTSEDISFDWYRR
jgi:hypothetical protein